MLAYKSLGRQDPIRTSTGASPFLCSQSMLSYLPPEVDHPFGREELTSGRHLSEVNPNCVNTTSQPPPPPPPPIPPPTLSFPGWRPNTGSGDEQQQQQRSRLSSSSSSSTSSSVGGHRESGGGALFRPPPLTLSLPSDYSPPSPRLYPSHYSPAALHSSPYFPAVRSPASAIVPGPSSPYFFPFPPTHSPYPSRHYLQIESYSAILASMGGGVGGGGGGGSNSSHPPPPRPTPIFSVSSSVAPTSSSPSQSQFGLLLPPHSHLPTSHSLPPPPPPPPLPNSQFSQVPSGLNEKTSSSPFLGSGPSIGSPGSARPSSTSTDECGGGVLTSPCHSPSYHHLYPCGKEGSLKHRILIRPGTEPTLEPLGSPTECEVYPPLNAGATMTIVKRSRTASPITTSLSTSVQTITIPSSSTLLSSKTPVLSQALSEGFSSGVGGDCPSGTLNLRGGSGSTSGGGGRLTTAQYDRIPPPPPPLQRLHYPAHFMKGSIIQLASGELKCVEDLRTEDFVSSADLSTDLQIDSSTVVRIEENGEKGTAELGFLVGEQRIQVTVEATLEHPFFVFGQGWSSCSPERTSQRYSLSCHRLQVGDVCISLTHRQRTATNNSNNSTCPRPKLPLTMDSKLTIGSGCGGGKQRRKRRWSASDALIISPGPLCEQRSNSLADDRPT